MGARVFRDGASKRHGLDLVPCAEEISLAWHIQPQGVTHTGKAKVTESTNACTRIKEEVGGFNVAMYYPSSVYITEGTEHAAKVCFYAGHGQRPEELLRLL